MSTVDKVIYDALAGRQSVVLPGVGSLVVKRRGAKKMPGDRIIPPQNVVSFTEDEIAEGESVVYLLASTRGVNEVDARALYDSWLESAGSDKGMAIKDVGEVRDGKFVIAQPLHTALNPIDGQEAIVLGKDKKCGLMWLWILLGLVLAAVVLVLLSYFGNGFLGIQKKPEVVVEVVEPVIAPVVAEPVVEEVVAEPAPEPAFHVIAGSFGQESNADSYVKKLQKAYPELTVQKVKSRFNGNWLVSIFNAPTERQAYNAMNKYWDVDLDLWVYEQK
jgi:hypothetical protein